MHSLLRLSDTAQANSHLQAVPEQLLAAAHTHSFEHTRYALLQDHKLYLPAGQKHYACV